MTRRIAYLILITVFASLQGAAQTVVVTDDNSVTTGDASSVLDVKSNSKGFLAPRMTEAQRTSISSPATGLLVYQTNNTAGYYYYDGSAWVTIAKGAGWTASGNNIYYNTGKVGIGNNSPGEALDVTGNIKFSGALMPGNDAGTAAYLLTSSGVGAAPTWSNPGSYFESYTWKLDGNNVPSLKKIGTTSNYDLPFITNNTEKMRLTSGGYLGVGVDSPSAPIHVGRTNQTSGITPIALFEETRDAGLSNSVVMMLGNKSINSNATKFLIGSTSSSKRWIMGTDKDGNNSQNFYLWDDNSVLARLYIDGTNGYTGLGTAAPQALLHVYSHLPASFDVPAAVFEGESDGGTVSLSLRNNSGARTKTAFIFGGSSSSYQWSLGNDVQGNNEHNFYIYDEGSFNTRFFIDQAGNVAIGNITPTELLDVSGNVKLSGALMPNNDAGTAGYVLTSAGPGNPPTWEQASAAASGWELDGNTLIGTKTLGTISAHDLPFITNSIERMRIKSDGKVGIGMSNPAEALDVTGNIKLSGNVTGGSWTGSIISPIYGGTGVNNGTKTITLGANLTTSGANNLTFTTTGTTNVTLPTSGTLATTAVTSLSSLATVGTITSGTWNGTVISPTYGGTGINNGSNTITLGGTLTTSGANNLTLTTTAATNVTLPTSGTLVSDATTSLPTLTSAAALATVGTITSGTWNGTVISPTYGGTGVNNGTKTITLGGNLTTSGANNITLTTQGSTNLTLPTSGTLASDATTSLPNLTSAAALATVGTITSGTWSGTAIAVNNGGTNITSYTTGAMVYASGATTLSQVSPNATATKQFLSQTSSGAPVWNTLTATDVPGALINVRVLTSGTSYTPATGTTKIQLLLLGGGGGGGGSLGNNNQVGASGGGGSGAIFLGLITGISDASSYTYAIGTGGAAGSNATGNGGTGGTTSITIGSTTYSAPGGSGGIGMAPTTAVAVAAGGAGGAEATGGTGHVYSGGTAGGRGIRFSGTVGGSGEGAGSPYGGGGAGLSAGAVGNDATGHGAGGGGALSTNNTDRAGGVGSPGLIIIHEYR